MPSSLDLTLWPDAPELTFDAVGEEERLEALRSLNLLDTGPESRFDRITRLAAEYFRVPLAYVAFIDDNRQWIKSRFGLCEVETPRNLTFCQYTLALDAPLVIPDTHLHPIGRTHPMVTGTPYVRFYAGVPLAGPKGRKVGTFCIVDLEPREFGPDQLATLEAFAGLVEREVNFGEIIQTQNDLLLTRQRLMATQRELEHEFADAARYVRGLLPPPLEGEEKLDWVYDPSARLGGDALGYRHINDDLFGLYVLDVTGHGLGSALLAVTAMEVLRNPAVQVDFTKPSVVLERLNRTFPMKDHGGKFFSVWYGVYSRSRQEITYSNAGHPPALIYTRENGKPELRRTKPGTSVLGVLPHIETPETTIPFPPGTELLVFSDGLYELTDPRGGRGSYDEFFAALQKEISAGTTPWEALQDWHKDAQKKKLIDDDVSILRFAAKA